MRSTTEQSDGAQETGESVLRRLMPASPAYTQERPQAARSASPADVLALQRTYGNQAVQRLLGGSQRDRMIQRHSSFEHRLLGDARPDDLGTVANNVSPENRQHVLTAEHQRLLLWQNDPQNVTEAQVRANWPDVRVLTLKNGLVVTYGELNTMGDYMANPGAVDNGDRATILPILQLVRQQGYNRLTDLLGATVTVERDKGDRTIVETRPDYRHFDQAIGPNGETGTMASINELGALNDLTNNLDTNRYQALVARNACHFAPYSWHRWQEFHVQARDLAQRGHAAGDQELIRQAWVTNGYADHFLQDSFAAGHLINKTLIMQWFVEWVQQYNANTSWYQRNIHLENWDQVQHMTTAEQPGLAGRQLYSAQDRNGASADPQRAEEQATQQQRMDTAGVQAGGGQTQQQEYQDYLAFLNNAVIQQASGKLHDYFNQRSLWVSSPAHANAYRIWGDDTMVTSGEGVQIAAQTAHMSQQAIQDISNTGSSAITPQQVRDQFPSMVRAEDGTTMLPLEQWNESLRTLCWQTIFPSVNYRILSTIRTTMGHVSQDAPR